MGRPKQNLHREQDILMYLSNGYDQSEIAGMLHISLNTVKHYTREMRTEHQASNNTELVAIALRTGVIK